jgi:hypothetical protein
LGEKARGQPVNGSIAPFATPAPRFRDDGAWEITFRGAQTVAAHITAATALTLLAAGPLAGLAVHGVFGCRDLVHGRVEHLELAVLLLHLLQLFRQLVEGVFAPRPLAVFHALRALAELLGQLVEPIHWLALPFELVELLLQLVGFGQLAGLAGLLNLLLEILLHLLVGVAQLLELLLQSLQEGDADIGPDVDLIDPKLDGGNERIDMRREGGSVDAQRLDGRLQRRIEVPVIRGTHAPCSFTWQQPAVACHDARLLLCRHR